jgi:hypothetical protein
MLEIDIGYAMGEYDIGPKIYGYWFRDKEQTWYVVYDKIVGDSLNVIAGQKVVMKGSKEVIYEKCITKNLKELMIKKIKKCMNSMLSIMKFMVITF